MILFRPVRRFALASTSPQKLAAVRRALSEAFIEADIVVCPVDSGVRAQPLGSEETCRGARNRARGAHQRHPDRICIGIESGVMEIGDHWIDVGFIVLLRPDSREIVATSAGFPFPADCVEEAERRGFDRCTVGTVIAERFGGDAQDPHQALSGGAVRREEVLTGGLTLAFRELKRVGIANADRRKS